MTATALSREHEHEHEHEHSRRAIAAHFAGRTSAVTEATMRAHLLTCSSCKDRYQRHLTLARLDPRALPAADRIARGLGFRLHGARDTWWRARLVVGLAISITAAAVFAIIPSARLAHLRATGAGGDFTARGTHVSGARGEFFWTYRLESKGAPRLANQAIRSGEELAFAYSNPTGAPFLMIFGVDEHRHVYWFHPAWPVGLPAPAAISAATGPGPHELPGAIRQPFDGQRLNVYAAFSKRALDATAIEATIRANPTTDTVPALGEGIVVIKRTYEVQP